MAESLPVDSYVRFPKALEGIFSVDKIERLNKEVWALPRGNGDP